MLICPKKMLIRTVLTILVVSYAHCDKQKRNNWFGVRQGFGWQWGAPNPANLPPVISVIPNLYQPLPPNFSRNSSDNPVVVIRDGALRGFTMRTASSRPLAAFQGIPFAQAPVGPLRFRDPMKNFPWNSMRDAILPSPQCIQLDLMRQFQVHGQEDCLYLNVYTPQLPGPFRANRKLPVMVWIHGGGFFFGSGSIFGPAYLLNQDVVLVTINYRIGPFGFLSTGDSASSGNQGLKDQALALRWVQENIMEFGGNPKSVTLFGESAGAVSIQHHIVSPMSRGLFHRGISQSGSSLCYWSILHNHVETSNRVGELLNCSRPSSLEMIDCLRNVDAEQIAPIQLQFINWNVFPVVVFAPVIEHNHPGAFMFEPPEETYMRNGAARVPWITGFNQNEMVWLISALILDSNAVADVNNNWVDKVSPVFLALEDTPEANAVVANKIWNFYMGNGNFSFENRHQFANLFGDRYVLECGLEAMRYHSRFTGQPVYGYRLSYQGRYSAVQLVGQSPQDWGVSHLDDLIYLLNNTNYYPELKPGDEEYQMSQIMTNIWSNFATYNRPLLGSEGHLQEIWMPIPQSTHKFSPVTFLDLNLTPRMIPDPYVDRYNFWMSLQLN